MRSILLAVVLTASTLVAHVPTADACGGYVEWRPTVRPVTNSFALLDDRLDEKTAQKLTWTRLDRNSYDNTSTAPGPKLAIPRTFTLVGPAGTKVIKVAQLTWVRVGFERSAPRAAVRIPAGDYQIVLDGELPGATWEAFSQVNGDMVTTFNADNLQLVTQHGTGLTSLNSTQSTFEGYPLGIVTIGLNGRYIAIASSKTRHSLSLLQI